jgi:hypothetical protein
MLQSGTSDNSITETEMAQKVSVLLVDDIDGSEAEETVPFGLDGTHYEIDLNSRHARDLRGQLDRYVKAARKATRPPGQPARARRTTANGNTNTGIRTWAKERGLQINERGRIPAEIMTQYMTENGE